jgi:hypothetical protein
MKERFNALRGNVRAVRLYPLLVSIGQHKCFLCQQIRYYPLNLKELSTMEMKRAAQLLTSRISRNMLFWLLYAFFHFYPRGSAAGYFVILGISIVTYGLPVYTNNLVLIPRYLIKRKYFLFGVFFGLLFFATVAETYAINKWAGNALPYLNHTSPFGDMGLPYHIFHIALLFTLMAFAKFLSDAIYNQRSLEQFQKQRLETELESLKAQVNPHFLFNALNTIYGMARRTDAQTANAVLMLSDILRHNIYDTAAQYISVEKEIEAIQQYIAFTRLRLHEKDNIKLNIQASGQQQRIVPHVLLPFVENAIKHGLDKYVENSYVEIDITLTGNSLLFVCSNYFVTQTAIAEETGSGTGLKNVRRRLELCYPGRHRLHFDTANNRYRVELQINLV